VASSKTVNWYDMTLMDEQSRISYQSAAEVAGGYDVQGAGTTCGWVQVDLG
jgi:hypothetical protein